MKVLRNKFVIGILCIAVGVAAGFILLPKAQLAENAMVEAVRLKQDTLPGTQLEPSMLEVITLPAASAPNGCSPNPSSFLSRYTVTQLYAGDVLTAAKVRDTLVDPVAAATAKGKQLVSVTVPSFAASVSGLLQPGDIVSVLVANKVTRFNQQNSNGEYGTDSDVESHYVDELRYLEVCKVASQDGSDALVNAVEEESQPNRLPVTVTLYATEAQALKLAEVEQSGDLHLSFRARGEDANLFMPAGERVLAEEPSLEIYDQPQPQPTAIPLSEQPQVTELPTETTTAIATDAPLTSEPEQEVFGE